MGTQISLQDSASSPLGIHPEVGLLDYTASLFLTFGGTAALFSKAAAPLYSLTNSVQGCQFFHILTSTLVALWVFLVVAILMTIFCLNFLTGYLN